MGKFKKGERKVQLWQAPEVAKLAAELIPLHHGHMTPHKLVCIFQAKGLKSRGAPAMGTASVVGGKTAAFEKGLPKDQVPVDGPERFFLITISWPHWINLTDAQKRALVDHELAHCGVSAKGEPCIWPHDLEEFRSIVERHGYWRPEVEKFAKTCAAAAQQELPMDEGKPPLSVVEGGSKQGDAKTTTRPKVAAAASQPISAA